MQLLRRPPLLRRMKEKQKEHFTISFLCLIRIFFSVFCMTVVTLPCWRELSKCTLKHRIGGFCVRPIVIFLFYIRMMGQTISLTADQVIVRRVRKGTMYPEQVCYTLSYPILASIVANLYSKTLMTSHPYTLLAMIASFEFCKVKFLYTAMMILASGIFAFSIGSTTTTPGYAAIFFILQIFSAMGTLHHNVVTRHTINSFLSIVEEVFLSSLVARVASDDCDTHYL